MATIIGNRILNGTAPVASDVPQNNLQGYQWQNGTTLYEWNTGTSQWVLIGNLGNSGYGLLSKAGGAVTGAITGPSGLAPIDAPNFTTSAKLNNVNLATVDDLSALETKINATIDSKISSSISTTQSSLTIGNNIKITREIVAIPTNVDYEIPQPFWTANGVNQEAIPWANSVWFAYPVALGGNNNPITSNNPDTVPDGAQGIINVKVKRVSENPAKVRVSSRFRNYSNNGETVNSVIIEYVIISIRN